ncbi:MAG: NUDIX domain-containing protein [Rhodothermales bacterium]
MSEKKEKEFREEFGASAEIRPPYPDAAGGNVFMAKARNGKSYYAYEFPHPSVAATVVVYDTARDAFLLIKRSTHPFFAHYAFPGGFLEVGKEEIEDAAIRELREEAGVLLDRKDLQLIDVRSHPKRDPRDHIFDIAYFATSENVQAQVGEEVSAFVWASKEEIDAMQLAFDHDELWANVKSKYIEKES